MSKLPHQLTTRIRGKVWIAPEGQPGPAAPYVYQRVKQGLGNIPASPVYDVQLRRHVIPTDYRTMEQVKCRSRLAAATDAWQTLNEEARQPWRERAKYKRMTGFNLFVRDFSRAHPLTTWIPPSAILTNTGAPITTDAADWILMTP